MSFFGSLPFFDLPRLPDLSSNPAPSGGATSLEAPSGGGILAVTSKVPEGGHITPGGGRPELGKGKGALKVVVGGAPHVGYDCEEGRV